MRAPQFIFIFPRMYDTERDQQRLVEAFESADVPTDWRFSHHEHVLVTWHLFHRHEPTRVIDYLRAGLKAIATSRGKPERYHETITWAFAILIHERIARTQDGSWDAFKRAHADLFDWETSIARYYSSETLDTEVARRVFVLPDRVPDRLPPAEEDS